MRCGRDAGQAGKLGQRGDLEVRREAEAARLNTLRAEVERGLAARGARIFSAAAARLPARPEHALTGLRRKLIGQHVLGR